MKTNRPTQRKRQQRTGARKKTRKPATNPMHEFEGDAYTGVREDQTWSLGKGKWNEARRGAHSWDISFETIALKPNKSNKTLPIGSAYRSYILAHQELVKTRSNTYQLKMEGIKFKLAHKKAEAAWSVHSGHQRNQLIRILKEVLHQLERGDGRAPSEAKRLPTEVSDN